MPARAASVLIVAPSWIGDMVMAQALFIRLREYRPGLAIDVLAPTWSLPILERMPQVRRAIEMPLGHGEFRLRRRLELGASLREQAYSQAIVLPGSWKSALVPFAARIPRRTGFRREFRYGLLNDLRPLDRQLLPRTVQQYLALAEDEAPRSAPARAQPRLRTDAAHAQALVSVLGLDGRRPAIALMPGAEYGPAKRWPAAHFREMTKALIARGYQVWIFGSAKERALGDTIAAGLAQVHNLAGQTQLADVVDLLALARAAVSNDSGLMHVAAAVGTPLVALYGSSSPEMTPPLTDTAEVLYLKLECSPCFARECPLKHLNCLRGITPVQVLDAVSRALGAAAGA